MVGVITRESHLLLTTMWSSNTPRSVAVRQSRYLRCVFDVTSLVLAFSFFITPFAPLAYAQEVPQTPLSTTEVSEATEPAPEQPTEDVVGDVLIPPDTEAQAPPTNPIIEDSALPAEDVEKAPTESEAP